MYRTDKQFMTNRATANSRIYIGGLAKTIVAQDLEEKFNQYGKILGLVLQAGFAFIQYENESQAQAAIQNEANSMLHGRKINVKQAMDKSKGNQNRRPGPLQGPPMQHGPGPQQGPPMQHGPGPQHQPVPLMQQQFNQPPQNQPYNHPQNQQQFNHPPYNQNQQQYNQPSNQQPYNQPPNQQYNNQQQQQPPPPPQNQQNMPPMRKMQEPQHHPAPPMIKPLPPVQQQDAPPPPSDLDNSSENTDADSIPPNNKQPPKMGGPPPMGMGKPMDEMQNNDMGGPNMPPHARRGKKRRVQSRDRFQPQQQGDFMPDQPFYGRPDNFGGMPPYNQPNVGPPMPPGPPVIEQQQPDRNDCEIIVVSKLLTKYAEYIEQRLKSLGLIVDLLFPNEDVPIGRVLANISSRGCLYAILVMPQNEEHRSLTLNVLHGLPQEHRNMPVEDALIFITRNFDAYMRGDKLESTNGTAIPGISDRHSTSMQLLINLLAENRQLTTSQYDRLIKYLHERREIQSQHEIEEGIDQDSQESNSKQAELQSRIMNILNKTTTATTGSDVGISAPPPPDVSASQNNDVAPPLLKDPSVQKALDSLLGGEMFKNIGVAL